MDDIFEELYYQFVYLPKKDACPERTARWEPFFPVSYTHLTLPTILRV